MTRQEIIEKLKESSTKKVKFSVADIDGVLRGKAIPKDKFIKTMQSGTGFCDVVFGWDINDAVYDNSELTGWHTGYPDAVASIDPGTFRSIPWNDDTPFFLADFESSESAVADACPRSLLKKIAKECSELGYRPVFSAEYEWFNFAETPRSLQEKKYRNLQTLTPGMFGYSMLRSSQNASYFNDLFEQLLSFKVPLEGLHTETGDGIYEASIAYSHILEASDRAAVFKMGVKEIAYQHGIIASFMAKWSNQLPGGGGHIHQSLWKKETETNLFFNSDNDNNISLLFEQYIAGQLYCLPHILPMFAPTVNSYKRFVNGSWAATTVSWGIQNRTTALRVINSDKNDARLETRVPGADANPYLVMAACLASGLYGIKNELTLDVQQTHGNEYANEETAALPTTLIEAIEAMKSSSIGRELFSESFVDHFLKTREWEWRQFTQQITEWEIKRYLEIV